MRTIARYLAIVALLIAGCGEASAQWMKERGEVRKGNRRYEKKEYDESIERYKKALQYDSTCFEAKFDLASALYRAERYEKAEQTLASLLDDEKRSEVERGEVAYNLGNVQFAQKKLKEALASYRLAMRYNPNDEDAKYNYAFVKRMLQQQEQQQNQNQDKNEQNNQQDNQKDNQQNNNNENNDKQDDQQEQNQPQKGENNNQEGERSESAMSPEQQKALLQAIQAEEDKTQDKLKEKAAVIVRGGKNW